METERHIVIERKREPKKKKKGECEEYRGKHCEMIKDGSLREINQEARKST